MIIRVDTTGGDDEIVSLAIAALRSIEGVSGVEAYVAVHDAATIERILLVADLEATNRIRLPDAVEAISHRVIGPHGATVALAGAVGVLLSDDAQPGAVARARDWLMPVAYEVPIAELADLDDWYEHEHTQLLLRCPDWKRTRRYAITAVEGLEWNRIVLHDLESDDVLSAPEVVASMHTTWRRRLAERPWFLAGGRAPLRRRA